MNKHLKILLVFIGLIGLFTSCDNDGMKVVMLDNPIAPTLTTVPDLTLQRSAGNDTLTFSGTPVDPGFQASANYFLEACASGKNFADPITLISGTSPDVMKIKVSDLNTILLRSFKGDVATSVDLRLRANLVVDAGTGAIGTSSKPLTYSSEIKTVDVTPYGLPRLDLIGLGTTQKIQSVLGDGVYTGYVSLTASDLFTLNDPDAATNYGDNGSNNGKLKVDGDAITSPGDGWYQLDADINNLTYALQPYNVGVVGAFTDWGGQPDHMMAYNTDKGYWYIDIDLPAGPMKFRLNSDWSVNWGPGADTDLPADGGTLALPDGNGNIIITSAGNYTIHLTLNGSSGSVTFIKN
ncbi:SusE domain-containing protein [Prolixibacter sp. SD074]|jgi:hypothetical protein|uniref:SusE domain-containing protein n=1 Tax=Prolixibacter sp. SD074 TaxID=2652391 RepID=UPI00127171C8|nr:SusE domain-containing protein [Prolixibacter sp. SD074]GET30388.1 hypothetical protein SD074_25900 [Prolixibacter sp. SD074]